MNVGLLLDLVADAAGDRAVLGRRDGVRTATELRSAARRAARMFARDGVRTVGFLGVNSEALPVALFGAALAGIPFAPVNYRLPDDKLRSILARLAPGLLVVDPDMADRVASVPGLEVCERDRFLAELTGAELTGAELTGSELTGSELTGPQLTGRGEGGAGAGTDLGWVDPDEVAVLLFTSGTTGEPKAAVLRHRHLASYVIGTVEFLGADEADAQLVSVPPYHIAGVSSMLSALYAGRRVVHLPAFDPGAWTEAVAAEGITHAMVVPTMLGRILDVAARDGADLSSLRHLSYGGGRMAPEVVERALRQLPGVDFVNAYGLTETSSTIAVLTPDDHRTALAAAEPVARRRLASVGRPLPTVELRIAAPDGSALAAGERGEVWVRGEQVAGEYAGQSLLDPEGWFHTRDAGWLDEDGYLYLDGRLDDVIVRGGENLSPGEVEEVLLAHPAVAEAAVVGIPDPEWGEAVAAAVVAEPGAHPDPEELREWVRRRMRSTYVPAVVDFRADLPYNETGKLMRRVLRDELAQQAATMDRSHAR